jgi:hypothetical protein
MIYIVEMILMGIWATLVMDILAIVFSKLKIIHPKIGPEIVGRWTLYMFRGKFIHRDINHTPAWGNEKMAALISHYLIGIILAGVYLFLEMKAPILRDNVWMALVFGIGTVILPFFWLYPSIGIGFAASKMSPRSPYITTSLVNHTDFGLGMLTWLVLFRRLFV